MAKKGFTSQTVALLSIMMFAFGAIIIYGSFYVPNTSKPAWMPHDQADDSSFATAQAASSVDPPISASPDPMLSSLPTLDQSQITQDVQNFSSTVAQAISVTNNVSLPSSSINTTVPAQFNASSFQGASNNTFFLPGNSTSLSNTNVSQSYQNYAPQHGVDASQSWIMNVTAVESFLLTLFPQPNSNSSVLFVDANGYVLAASKGSPPVVAGSRLTSLARPIIGQAIVGYNSASKALTVTKQIPSTLRNSAAKVYQVVASSNQASGIVKNFKSGNFIQAANVFTSALQNGQLKWSSPNAQVKHAIVPPSLLWLSLVTRVL